jgi:cytochrome b subunit of formate dehydrogenase
MEESNQHSADRQKEIELRAKLRRRNRRALMVALSILTAYIIHLYFAYGKSFSFITNLFTGDVITISSTLLTLFTVSGWIMLYFAFRKYF